MALRSDGVGGARKLALSCPYILKGSWDVVSRDIIRVILLITPKLPLKLPQKKHFSGFAKSHDPPGTAHGKLHRGQIQRRFGVDGGWKRYDAFC